MRSQTLLVMDEISLTLINLMEEKNFDEISICEITKKAKVSRNSFYRHFSNKDDILRHYISRETDKWLGETNENYLILNAKEPQAYIIFLLEHMYKYRATVKTLIRDNKMHLLEEEFDKRFQSALSGISDPWHIAFITGGFYKLFRYWAETGYEKTPQEVAEYIK